MIGRGRGTTSRRPTSSGPADPNAFQLGDADPDARPTSRRLGVEGPEGGFHGPDGHDGPGDGKLYSFALRPLLPDETE